METIIEVRDIHKAKHNGNEKKKEVLNGISTQIFAGDIFAIIGPSGGGKSTFLRMLNRLEEIDKGQIYFRGKHINEYHVLELRRKIGMITQLPSLFPMSIGENIAFGPRLMGEKFGSDDAAQYLRMVGLPEELIYRDPQTLSVGQQQRVSIARALANHPQVLLMDEPTSALDITAVAVIEELIVKLNRELGLTIVIVTHNILQAKRIATRIMFLAGGTNIEEGPKNRFFANPQREQTREFLFGTGGR